MNKKCSLSKISIVVIRGARVPWLALMIALACIPTFAMAGKSSYPEFLPELSHETVEILKRHGMPVAQDREDPWFRISGVPGIYTLKFHQADEIPQQAVLDVVKLCMDFYELRGRKEKFRIVLYRESHMEWRNSLFLGVGTLTTMKPHFELTIGRGEQ